MGKGKAFINWSSGKDATMALHTIQTNKRVSLLLTAISEQYQRVTMHGLHRSLLEAQSTSLGIPLEVVELPSNPTMEVYEKTMMDKLSKLRKEGYDTSYFGDIFLEDLKTYRENLFHPLGFETRFPLWKKDTRQLLLDFIAKGFKAIVVAVDAQELDKSFCGRLIDQQFLEDLPDHVDPCGENGEFHTFCFDGPIFHTPIAFSKGALLYKTYPSPKAPETHQNQVYGSWYCDLQLLD
ncbi:MAG: diphthine--ammonia ligase [Bacteroidota bacterium]